MSEFEQAKTHAALTGKKLAGKLKNCRIIDFTDYAVACGNIYDDNRWSDSTEIRTSAIVKYSEEHNYIETNNSLYLVEGKATRIHFK
jgi:hypothetical protein